MKNRGHVYIMTGDSGNGMTHGTLGAKIISDLVMGRENPWAKTYSPHRFAMKAVPQLIKENATTAMHYADWITAGEISSVETLSVGSGAVLREGTDKVEVYRSDEGFLHKMSATCPHLGGVVHWNDSEKTWDCPCHGSRFTALGQVINGPAAEDLKNLQHLSPIALNPVYRDQISTNV